MPPSKIVDLVMAVSLGSLFEALTAVDRKRSYSRSVEARGSAQPVIVRKDNAY